MRQDNWLGDLGSRTRKGRESKWRLPVVLNSRSEQSLEAWKALLEAKLSCYIKHCIWYKYEQSNLYYLISVLQTFVRSSWMGYLLFKRTTCVFYSDYSCIRHLAVACLEFWKMKLISFHLHLSSGLLVTSLAWGPTCPYRWETFIVPPYHGDGVSQIILTFTPKKPQKKLLLSLTCFLCIGCQGCLFISHGVVSLCKSPFSRNWLLSKLIGGKD